MHAKLSLQYDPASLHDPGTSSHTEEHSSALTMKNNPGKRMNCLMVFLWNSFYHVRGRGKIGTNLSRLYFHGAQILLISRYFCTLVHVRTSRVYTNTFRILGACESALAVFVLGGLSRDQPGPLFSRITFGYFLLKLRDGCRGVQMFRAGAGAV